jgi:hypothetical protein
MRIASGGADMKLRDTTQEWNSELGVIRKGEGEGR